MKRKDKPAKGEAAVVEEVAVPAAAAEEAPAADKKAQEAAKKAQKSQKKAQKARKKATKTAKKAQKAAKKAKKSQPVTKKAAIFGSPIRNLIVTAVVSILLGVAFLAEPTLVYTYCGYAIGGLIALVGVVYIVIYFLRKPVSGVYRSEFALGLVALLAGAYVAVGGLLTDSGSTTSVSFATIVRILGILMAADGILKLQYTLDIARMKYKKWWIALIFSVLGIALGVITVMGLTYELGTTMGIGGMMMLGIAFCLNGALDLAAMIIIAVRNHQANKAAVVAEAEAMVAAATQEEAADFFPEDDTSADGDAAPAEEADFPEPVTEPEPEPMPEPEPEPEPEPQPEPAPAPEPEVFEPELPEPVLASPTGEDGE